MIWKVLPALSTLGQDIEARGQVVVALEEDGQLEILFPVRVHVDTAALAGRV